MRGKKLFFFAGTVKKIAKNGNIFERLIAAELKRTANISLILRQWAVFTFSSNWISWSQNHKKWIQLEVEGQWHLHLVVSKLHSVRRVKFHGDGAHWWQGEHSQESEQTQGDAGGNVESHDAKGRFGCQVWRMRRGQKIRERGGGQQNVKYIGRNIYRTAGLQSSKKLQMSRMVCWMLLRLKKLETTRPNSPKHQQINLIETFDRPRADVTRHPVWPTYMSHT